MAKLNGGQIAGIVIGVVVVVVIVLTISIIYGTNNTSDIPTGNQPQLYPYAQTRAVSLDTSIPRNFSVWGFSFRNTTVLSLDVNGNLILETKAWTTNPNQRWTCAIRQGQNEFNRGVYVIQNLGQSSRVLCSGNSGIGTPQACTPLDVGSFSQQWYMITLSKTADSATDTFALVNRRNNLALSVNTATMTFFFDELDGSNPDQQFDLWQLTVS